LDIYFKTKKERLTEQNFQKLSRLPDQTETSIDLFATNITDDTFLKLKEHFSTESSVIQTISMRKVTMTFLACQQFCELLTSEHCKISEFHIEQCKMQSRMIDMLFDALGQIATLSTISIKSTNLIRNSMDALSRLLSKQNLQILILN
jgi:hypothetical protein